MKYRILKVITDLLVPLIVKLEVKNKPEFPKDQGALVAANHIHAFDPVLLSYALYPEWLHHIAKEEIFRIPLLPIFLNWVGVIPLKRKRPGAKSIKKAMKVFSKNKIVCIFPQGTRRTKQFGTIKKGAARLALSAEVPIYPAAITGLENMSFWGIFKRPRVKIIFGEPIFMNGRENTKEEVTLVTKKLESSLKELYGKIYSK